MYLKFKLRKILQILWLIFAIYYLWCFSFTSTGYSNFNDFVVSNRGSEIVAILPGFPLSLMVYPVISIFSGLFSLILEHLIILNKNSSINEGLIYVLSQNIVGLIVGYLQWFIAVPWLWRKICSLCTKRFTSKSLKQNNNNEA